MNDAEIVFFLTLTIVANSEKGEQEVMEVTGGGEKTTKKRLSGHHVDLIDHSRARLVYTLTKWHTVSERPNQYVTKERGMMMQGVGDKLQKMEEGKGTL